MDVQNSQVAMPDTIVAPATSPSRSAIGIVRVSGALASDILCRMLTSKSNNVDKIVSRRVYYSKLYDPSTGYPLDDVQYVYFQSPKSYTGEEMVEIFCHGNPVIVDRIVGVAVGLGARLSEPGEFTRRAFMNGKIDLVQAEAVADCIAASSESALRAAREQMDGRLSRCIRAVLADLTTTRAQVEALIDFPEDDISPLALTELFKRLSDISHVLINLSDTFRVGKLYREGVTVAIVGPPNAGKSSLLNALLGEDRALVHYSAGTTRDFIEESIIIEGITFRLVDTAGLRALTGMNTPHDEIEQLGMDLTSARMLDADIGLLVLDGSIPLTDSTVDLIRRLPHRPDLIWCNKSDLGERLLRGRLHELVPGSELLSGAAKFEIGMDNLRKALVRKVRGESIREPGGAMLTNRRHKVALDKAISALSNAMREISAPPDLLAVYLRDASDHLGSIVGEVTTDDLLCEIFSRFCIGK